jgi:hypothetical protein
MFSTDSSQDGGGGRCGDPTGTSGWDVSSMDILNEGSRFIAKLSSSGKLKWGESGALDNRPLAFEDDVELEISITPAVVLLYWLRSVLRWCVRL